MSADRITRIVGLFWLPVLLIGAHASAQNVVFVATANAQKIGLNDRLEVTYELRDVSSVTSISNGGFRDFIVVGGPFSSTFTQMSDIGGRMAQSTVFRQTYALQPRRTGSLMIPAAVVEDGAGHTFRSNTLKVQVVPGSQAPQGKGQMSQQRGQTIIVDPYGRTREEAAAMARQQAARRHKIQPFDPSRDIMLRVVPDKTSVHLGEQVTLSYKLYTRADVSNSQLMSLPSLEGCWTQELEVPRNAEPVYEAINGRNYAVFVVRKTALFPQTAGPVNIEPVVFRADVRIEQEGPATAMAMDPSMAISAAMMDPYGDEFGSFYRDVPVELRSTPVTLNVSDVPDARPEGYKGATGDFTISGHLNSTQLTTDDIINYTVRISGRGNIKLFGAPDLKLPAGLQAYDPQITDSINGVGDKLGGIKTITYSITPSKAGNYTLPGVSFTFFNTATNNFENVQTSAHEIQVRPGAGLAQSRNSATGESSGLQLNATRLDAGKNSAVASLLANPWYWAAYGLPLLVAAGIAIARRRKAGIQSAGRRADQQALRRLASAKDLMQPGNETAFYEEISASLWLYLSDRLSIPPSQLSRSAAGQALGARRVPTAVTMKLDHVLQDCEMALYAPNTSPGQMQHAYHAAAGVISEIETFLQA